MEKWGPPIWAFIHTFTVKIKNNEFLKNRDDILPFIHNISTNLPCPVCTEHAKKYFMHNKLYSIRNKEDLKILFLNFHNNVNERLGKPIQEIEVLEKYETMSLNDVAYNYIVTYLKGTKNSNLTLNSSFVTSMYTKGVRKWLSHNLHMFED